MARQFLPQTSIIPLLELDLENRLLHTTHTGKLTTQHLPSEFFSVLLLSRIFVAFSAHALQYFFGPLQTGKQSPQRLQVFGLPSLTSLQSRQNLSAWPVFSNVAPHVSQSFVLAMTRHLVTFLTPPLDCLTIKQPAL